MKVLPRLRYILEVIRPSPPVVQDVLDILTRFCRHSSTSATQVATQILRLVCRASQRFHSVSSAFHRTGARLSPFDGGAAVRVPSHVLARAFLDSASDRLRTPALRRHEAAESLGYVRQARLRQTGER